MATVAQPGYTSHPDTPSLLHMHETGGGEFVILWRSAVEDKALSYGSVGLLAWLSTRPDGYVLDEEAGACADELEALEDAGYLHKWSTRWVLSHLACPDCGDLACTSCAARREATR